MTSRTKNLHEETTSPNANKAIKMTNTKRQDHAVPGEGATSSQQDLIRLLAQHFNNQFYQMAANSQPHASHPADNPPQLNSMTNNAINTVNHFQSPLALAQYHQQQQQQQQQQFRAGQEAVNFVTNCRAVPPPGHGLGPGTVGGQSLVGQLARSHPNPNSGPVHHPRHHPQHQHQHHSIANQAALASSLAMNPNPPACNPLFRDGALNLFNCFNMTSDQFLLSLQQQYLLQAASTVRQTIESRQMMVTCDNDSNTPSGRNFESLNLHNQSQQLSLNLNRRAQGNSNLASSTTTNITNANNGIGDLPGETSAGENQSGRELLKFSINTILGRGSQLSSTPIDELKAKPSSHLASQLDQYLGSEQDRIMGASGTADARDCDRVASSPECDLDINSDIDSNSSSTSTPQPTIANQAPNNSMPILNKHAQRIGPLNLNDHRHPSAASSSSHNQRISPGEPPATDINQQSSQGHHQTTLSFLTGTTAFPWAVAARGKPRRGMMRRAVFSDSQRVGLEKRFQLQKYISKPDRKKLAEKLGLRDSQVKIWFQNRRMKWRNSKERELLSAGGSREQTLPTKNNPNPDLSDVGETMKRLVPS